MRNSPPSLLSSFLFLSLLLPSCILSLPVTISNTLPKTTTDGLTIIDAHDGPLFYIEQEQAYFWYAMSYGLCEEPPGLNGCSDTSPGNCGFRFDHNLTLYTSPDLSMNSWTNHGPVFSSVQNRPYAIYYSPTVVYNKHTQQYVLWINYFDGVHWNTSTYLSALSSSPYGPFEVVNQSIPLRYGIPGSPVLFVDDDIDNTAYVIYDSLEENHGMSIEQLATSYTYSLGVTNFSLSSGIIGPANVEAPVLWKQNGVYLAVWGYCCCFCGEGSNIMVWGSTVSPLGPWTYLGEIGINSNGSPSTLSQISYVFPVRLVDGTTQMVYIGDRWQSSPDGLKAHDFTYFAPLPLGIPTDNSSFPTLQGNMTFLNQFTLNLATTSRL